MIFGFGRVSRAETGLRLIQIGSLPSPGFAQVLGRYWSVGPQFRLYCPASWLKQGVNVIDILDLELTEPRPVRGCVERNYDLKNAATRNANNEW